ncbi:hypothetical protein BDY19DRAFT_932612 [Irpex rosettiformis]|uniref:Uncharacterized protein n=1 Tax=Irpex rosettiformis TaxID=378272 RepID=A0ACB8UA18_9APHY|nr:hypothetical protein BDY19DRAFT_932612 [Irpex rosettiformis]
MPQIPVNNNGRIVLDYEDSGPPQGTDCTTNYTTIVIAHGLVFYAPVFHRLLPYAHEHNFRIVLLNMRDYADSSPFSPSELGRFSTSPHDAVKEIGHQFAAFLTGFIQKHQIPEIKVIKGKQTGGLVFSTWSFSNTFHMSLLGNAHTLPKETKTLLSKYWRRSVMYDPAFANIGAAPPVDVYSPLRDASLSPRARAEKFSDWVSSYSPPVPAFAIATYTRHDLVARQRRAADPQYRESLTADYMRTTTIKHMSAEELEGMTDFGVVERSTRSMRNVPREIYEDNARRALWEPELDPDSESGDVTFLNLGVVVLWFDMTIADCIWAVKVLHDARIEHSQRRDSRARDVEFVCLEGLNHFAHWDDPARVMRALAEHI